MDTKLSQSLLVLGSIFENYLRNLYPTSKHDCKRRETKRPVLYCFNDPKRLEIVIILLTINQHCALRREMATWKNSMCLVTQLKVFSPWQLFQQFVRQLIFQRLKNQCWVRYRNAILKILMSLPTMIHLHIRWNFYNCRFFMSSLTLLIFMWRLLWLVAISAWY